MKIVVVETDAAGGLIHFAYQLAEGLAAAGADTTLLTGTEYELADHPGRARVEPVLKLWSPVEDQPDTPMGRWFYSKMSRVRRGLRGLRLAREWGRIVRILRREKPDLVVFSMIRFPFLSLYLRALKRMGIHTVQICHEFRNREAGTSISDRIWALFPDVYAQFDTIFLLSKAAQADFCALYPEHADRTALIPHGPELLFAPSAATEAELRAHYEILPEDRIVLMIGGLRPSKGVPDLIHAFAQTKSVPNARLIVAGYPSREFNITEVNDLVKELGLTDQVTLDYRYLSMEELGGMVRRANVVAFPYLSATSSGALALAQSEGRPILATAVGGLTDVVDDGRTGRLVPKGDTVAMGAALSDLLNAPEKAEAMAAEGQREILQDRSWESIARTILSVAEQAPEASRETVRAGATALTEGGSR